MGGRRHLPAALIAVIALSLLCAPPIKENQTHFGWIGSDGSHADELNSFQQPNPAVWRPAGFGGAGSFLSVHFDPNHPGVIYAASDVAGVLRSTDYGDHWEIRSVGLGNHEVSSFAVDPFDTNTLYAGAGGFASSNKAGIYVSHDAGLTWQQLPGTFANHITFRRFRTVDAIAPDPTQQGAILAGSRENGIWRSTDDGLAWTQVYAAPPTSAPFSPWIETDDPTTNPHPSPVSVVLFDPANPSVVYAGLNGAGVVKSTARGVAGSWQSIQNGLPAEATVMSVAIGGGVLYAALGTAGIYKSTDGGLTWQQANGGLPPLTADERMWGVTSVTVHPTNPSIAYLTLATYDYANVWKTTDGGATWVPKGDFAYDPVNDPTEAWGWANPTMSWGLALDRANPNRLFYAGYWDIIRSDDGGEHWATRIVGAQNTCVTDLMVDMDQEVGQPDVLYATHMDAGLLSSANKGLSSTVFPETYDPALAGHYWDIAIARLGGTKYYYTTSDPWDENYGQVLRSTDGINWMPVFSQTRPPGQFMGGAMLGLAVDPSHPSTLYVTQDGGQVWKSANNGNTWAPTTGQPGGSSFTYALVVDAAGRVFAGTLHDGLWRTADGGGSWAHVLIGQDTIYHLLAVLGAVYASAGDANLYRSTDGGTTWQRLTNFSSVDDGDGVGDQGMAIAVDPNNPNHILFSRTDPWHPADAGAGIVESTDGGTSWAPLNTGLRHRNVSALAVGQDGTVFAGTWCGGIWALGAPPAFDFSLSNSGGIAVAQGGSGSNMITATLVSGSPESVSLSCTSGLPSGASCSFNPASGNPTFTSGLTITTSPSTPTGSSTVTVTGSGGGLSRTTQFTLTVNPATNVVPLSSVGASVLNAPANNVYYIYPATVQTGGVKDPHVIYASAADWSATGLILGLSVNSQNIGLDSDGLLCSTSNGQPLSSVIGSGQAVVMVSGPIVHAGVHYYEVHGAGVDKAPVYFAYDATTFYFRRSSDGSTAASMLRSQAGVGSDIFLIEVFQDAVGRTVLVMYGFSYLGTLAASTCFKFTIYPSLSTYTQSYYLIQWTDATSGLSQNGIPDMGDTYTPIASG